MEFEIRMSLPIIIPLQHSINKDIELMYALRSLEKCITGIGEVIIIGDKPLWPNQDLTILECKNVYNDDRYRDANIYHKMKLGFEYIDSPRALVMHDDNFFKMYSAVEDWPWYYGDWPSVEGGLYREVIQNTLLVATPGTMYSDIHCAHVVSKKAFEQLDALRWDVKGGWCIKTLSYYGEQLTKIPDLKLSAYYTPDEIRSMIKERPWFSTADNIWNSGGIHQVMKELYLVPSKWEL